MPLPRRPVALFVVLTYLILSAAPFAPLLFGRPAKDPAYILGIALLAWIAAWAVFKRPARFHWLLLPAFIAMPVELYLQTYYNQGISTHHLGILAETSPNESLECLGNKVCLLGVLAAGACAWWWFSWKAAYKTGELDWNDPTSWGVIAALAVGAGASLYAQTYGVERAVSAKTSDGAASARFPPLPAWAKVPLDANAFGASWPFGLAVRGYEFWKERAYLSELTDKSGLFEFKLA